MPAFSSPASRAALAVPVAVAALLAALAVPSLGSSGGAFAAPPAKATPVVTFTSGPDPSTTATAASFSWTVTRNAATTCSLDGAAATACVSPTGYSGLAVGAHSFAVTAKGGTTATWTWAISAPAAPASTSPTWSLQDPQAPITYVTNSPSLGLNINNQTGGSYQDYVIDGGGDSSVLLQGSTNGVSLARFHLTRTDANPAVTWAAHGIYVKAINNSFTDIYADNTGGNGISGISVRMHGNSFTRTVLSNYIHAVTYYEHDGSAGTVTFTDGDWTFTGDTAVWGDDSNDPPTPYIKQTFLFENINAHGPAGAKFLKFGTSAYNSNTPAYQGAGITIRNCTINGHPVTATDITGVPANLLTIQ